MRLEEIKTRFPDWLVGAAAGCIVLMILGSFWPGWSIEPNIQKRIVAQNALTLERILAPECVRQFRARPDATEQLAKLKASDSWKRDTFIMDGKYGVPTGDVRIDRSVAQECANQLER
jgi:hypothetical protein